MSSLKWQLYVIIDRLAVGHRPVEEVAAAAIKGGADVIQLRDKISTDAEVAGTALRLLALTRTAKVPLIINDRAEVACEVQADGLHVGQEDEPIERVRAVVGKRMIIGKSTHNLKQAISAQAEGADYIGFGPLFATPTKPHYGSIGLSLIRQAADAVHVPMVCIGGIDTGNLEDVLKAGAACVAVVRAVCAAEDPEAAARSLKQQLIQFNRAQPGKFI